MLLEVDGLNMSSLIYVYETGFYIKSISQNMGEVIRVVGYDTHHTIFVAIRK